MRTKRTLHKTVSWILTVAMLLSMVPSMAFASVSNTYQIGDDTQTITYTPATVAEEDVEPVAESGPVAKVGNTEYATIDEAIANWTNGTTLTLLSDVTLSDVVTLKSTEHHILNLGTYTMTAASGKNAFVIKACGTGDAECSAITINADAENPGGINAGKQCVVYYKYADGGIATNDRPIIKINGGVFTGSTSSFGTAGIYTIGTAARKCATLDITGGTFNCSINGSGKSKLIVSGGTFNYSVGSQGDSTALRLISGGKFKTLGFMTADSNNTKFWFGTSMANSNVGVYVDKNNYLVVGGPVITDFGNQFKAKATNATKWSSYLAYSSAATNGLFYEDAEMAIAKHGAANVEIYQEPVVEKPSVVIPDTLTGEVVEEIKNNTALKDYTPENLPTDAELVIKLTEVETKSDDGAPARIVYDVTPMANGVEVEPTEEITFRLPIPASVNAKLAKVAHDTDDPESCYIQGEGDGKYVEVSSEEFSTFTVEPVTATEGYILFIYNGDGTVGMEIDGTKSVSEFCLKSAIEDARVFANNGFLFGITGTPSFVVEMYGDSIEKASFEIGSDVTINGNGHKIVCAEGVEVTVASGAKVDAKIVKTEPAFVPSAKLATLVETVWSVSDEEDREAFNVQLREINAQTSLVVKVYSDDTLLTTTTLRDELYPVIDNGETFNRLTVNIVLWGRESGSWSTEVNTDYLTEENIPNYIKVYCDGELVCEDSRIFDNEWISAYKGLESVKPVVTYVATLAELQAALADTSSDLPIVITAQIEIPAGESVELDLKGKTVNSVFNGSSTTNHIYALSNKGTLTITDTVRARSTDMGSINSRGIYNYGSLTLNGGAINAIDGNGGYAVNNENGSTFVMNGGVVAVTCEDDHQSSSGGYDATALDVPEGCTATLNGGQINSVADFTFAVNTAGTLIVPADSTIKVNGTHGAIFVSGGTATIDAGTYTIPKDEYSRTDNVLYVSGGSLVINGGTFTGDSDTASGGSCVCDEAGTAIINGGSFSGSSGGDVWGTTGTTIQGGKFENLTEKQHIVPGYELGEDGNVVQSASAYVAQIGEDKFETLQAAIDAAKTGDEIKLIDNVTLTEALTLPAGISFNGNGKQINGSIVAGGNLTFKGHTKVTSFDVKYTNTTINIGEGACLELTGSGRMVIGHGCTFNITGTIADAKTADKANIQPSLIMPGASFTGAGVTFNVKNAYIKAPSSYCSSSKSASGTFDFNIEKSIVETAGKLAFEAQSTAATVNFELKDSVLTTGSHLVFSCEGETVIDNSNVNVGKSHQLENRSTMTIKNGSVVNGAVATSSNAINPGTIIVENATYAVTGQFSGAAEGAGTLIIKKGATVSVGSIVDKADIVIDATGMAAGDAVNFTGNLSKFVGNMSVVNNDKLEAKIVDGNVVLAVKPVAKIGDKGYETLTEAMAAAQAGDTVTILAGDYTQDLNVNKAIVLCGETDAQGNNLVNITGRVVAGTGATIKNLNVHNEKMGDYACALCVNGANITVDGVKLTGYNGMKYCYAEGNVTIKNSFIEGSKFAVHFDGSNGGNLVIDNCKITGWVSYGGDIDQVTLKDSIFNQGSFAGQRSYADALVIEGSTFNTGYKLDIAVKDSNVTVTGSKMSDGSNIEALFNSEDVVSNNVAIDGEKMTYVAKIGDAYYTTLEEALANVADWTTIKLVADATLDYNAREAYGRDGTTDIIIDGQGFKLTLNQTNNDWSSIGMKNPDGKLTLKNMTIEKTGYGDTSGAWNTHAINFDCNVEMNNVTVNNSMCVENGATLKNVTINEVNGYYGLWISGNGQSVTVNGGTINATNGGRGIKIADEYVDAPASVTLSVTGTKFNTAKKAAVLVTSTAGASITASNVDIANVAEDSLNFVWVDDGRAAHYGKVEVSGATVALEAVETFAVVVKNGDKIESYFKTLADAMAAADAGDTIELLADVEASEVILIDKSLTINGNDHKVTSSATRVFRVTTSNVEVTLNKVNMVSNAVVVYPNDVRGISIDPGLTNVKLTLENCSVDFTDASANDWTYAVNISGNGNGHTLTVNGGTYEGANVINVHGANNTIVVKDATLNCLYPNNDMYSGACFWVLEKQGSSVEATGNTFNGDNAIAFNLGTGTALTESNNIDNTKRVVAKIGDVYYTTLAKAMAAAKAGETVVLIADVDLAGIEWEPVSFKGAFDGQNHVIENLTINKPGVSNTGFITSLNGTFKNVTFTNPTVTGGECTGVLAGSAGGSSALAENITVNGTIKVETTHSGYARAGVIVGGWAYGNYKNITVDGGDKSVSYIKHTGGGDGRYVAGIVGHADKVTSYENCTVKNITISGGWLCGGIAGPGPAAGIASGCAVENVNVDADYSGGMFGWYFGNGTIENSAVKNVAFTGGTANNGAIGGYAANPSANVNNVTIENVTNNGKALLEHVAQVGETYYFDLQEAINAADGKTVVILSNAELTETLTIPAGKTVIVDLNGKTVSMKTANDAVTCLILNMGKLTISDSVGGGKLSYHYTGTKSNDAFNTVESAPGSVLTVKGGTIENLSADCLIAYAVDGLTNGGNGDVTVNIEGGIITSQRQAVRIFANSTTNTGTLNISGGAITGRVIVQNASAKANKAVLNITGGTFNANDYKADVLYVGGGESATIEIKASVSGGKFYGEITKTNVTGFISGGAFTVAPEEACLAKECSIEYSNKMFVVKLAPEASVGGTDYATLAEAFKVGGTIYLKRNVVLDAPLVVEEGQTINLVLNGHSITYTSDVMGEAMITNKGTLTIYNRGNDILPFGTEDNGKIVYTYTGAADNSYGKGNYTISNAGNLTVNGGMITISNLSGHAKYPIDNNSTTGNAVLVINGGHLYNYNTSAIRQFCNSTTYKNSVTINGGLIEGYCAVWVQNPGSKTVHGQLTITGGEIKSTAKAYVEGTAELKDVGSAIYFTIAGNGGAWSQDSIVSITGGTFNENVSLAEDSPNQLTVDKEKATFNGYLKMKLAGSGTEADPFVINNLDDLILFRDSVNAGETKYSAKGVYVALGADIDLVGINWIGIGSINKDHGFMGNFDGKGFKIKNLTITDPILVEGYAYAGFFSITEGTEEEDGTFTQNTIKNLVIENVTINTDGDIVAAAIAYPSYTIVDDVTVCGNIAITGGNYTSGVLAYTRRCVDASDLTIVGNDGSTIEGKQVVGGVIADIQMNGGLTANYSNFSASGVKITGEKNVGGISGIIATQTLNGATVKDVTLVCNDARVGAVAGCLGGTSTIQNVTTSNVEGAAAVIGGTYDGGVIEAKVGDTYYAKLQAAIDAANGNEVILLAPIMINAGETLEIDLKGQTVVGTDNATGSFGLININPGAELTINDSVGGGIITLTATKDRDWNAYSSVISNQRGKLTVNGGTIEHLGGTDMAYGIDNLTNGKGTYAETVINGGTVKSPYRAIRQFLNGTEAQNILTVNSGTIEGANKSIWMQEANAGANPGTLTVGDKAVLKGDVYLSAADGATKWPIKVSVAAAALYDGSKVLGSKVPDGYVVENKNGTWGVRTANYVAQIKDGAKFESLAEALTTAENGATINLIWAEGDAPIAMNGSVFGKSVTITGTATVDWSKGFLFIGRGGEGNGTVIFDNANLTSASDNASYGIHVSGREKNTNNKYDGTLFIKNSTIELDYLINKGTMTLDNSTLTVKNGFAIGGRPATETESGEDATATLNLTSGSKVVVNNHNGMGLGYEAIGVMNIDATSTLETTQDFLVTAKGTMNVAGTATVAGTLTNKGSIVLTAADAKLTSSECGNVTTNVDGYKVAYADGAYKLVEVAYMAQIGETRYETVAAALKAAKDAGMTEVTIKLIGKNTKETADDFNLCYATQFDSVTFKQDDASNPYYFKDLYTGSRTNGGEFVFDGVNINIVVTGQYMFEGNVRLTNNSIVKSAAEANCFLYNSTTTVEPGSKLFGVIDDLRGGDLIVDGGRDDGAFNETPDVQDAMVIINWSGDSITLKNGAYFKVNSADEIGRLTINNGAVLNVDDSKVDAVEYIANNGTINTDVNSVITTRKVTGAGKIVIDATNFNGAETLVIKGDMSGFTGTIEVNGDAYHEITTEGVVLKAAVASVNGTNYSSLQAAIDAAQSGDTITVIANIADVVVSVDKNVTITGSVAAYNVGINAVDGCTELTVSGLTFTGNSWINSGEANKLTVSGVTADVTPSNTAYTNSRSAFISLGKSEQKTLELTIENSNIVSHGGTNPVLGWASITKATITNNTFGSKTAYQNNSDSIKFMAIADGAEFVITGNTVYSDYNGIVFGQNTTRGNAYTVNLSDNTFIGAADHIWIEISGGDTCHASVNAASDNTVNGKPMTAKDLKAYTDVIKNWTSYVGVDVETDASGKVVGGTLMYYAEDAIAEGYEAVDNGDGTFGVKEKVEIMYTFDTSMQAYLTLKDIVQLNVCFKLKDLGETDPTTLLNNLGLLVWDMEDLPAEPTIENCDNVYTNTTYNKGKSRFEVRMTDGIPAKELGDSIAVMPYYTDGNGNYVYGRMVKDYSPKKYCYGQLNIANGDDHALMIAILNYGAAAQDFFNYREDSFMNADLTAEQKALSWDGSLVRSDWSVPSEKEGVMGRDNTVIVSRGGYLSLVGTIDPNYYIKVAGHINVAKAEILLWSEEQYKALDVLTKDNAGAIKEMVYMTDKSRYEYKHEGIAAKEMFSAVYACAMITDTDGNVYYGGVLPYCAERYAYIASNGSDQVEAVLGKRIAIYGDAAREYFP